MPPLAVEEARGLLAHVDARWALDAASDRLSAELTFPNFVQAMGFLNRLAEVAEQEGHHPDFCLHGWRYVRVELRTHAVNGLSSNDFILAAKIDELLAAPA